MVKVAAVALAALGLCVPAAAQATKPPPGASLLVKFSVSPAQVPELLPPGDKVLGRTLNGVHVIRIKRSASSAARIALYERLAAVEYAEPNATARGQLGAPNDPSYSSQWALGAVRALGGWSVWPGSYAGAGAPTIAILDTGVDSGHPELTGRVLTQSGANCVKSDAGTCQLDPALDDNGHGTHVAGIAAASTNNGTGIAGASYASPVLPVKVLKSDNRGSYASITNGILWASQQGARVINLSLGGNTPSQTMCDAVQRAIIAGAVVVVAAGNGSTSTPSYPAACAGAVGVASTDNGDAASSFSNYGSPNVYVSAPGGSIYSTYRGGSYRTMSGTSMAAPLVSGLAALLIGEVAARTPAQVKLFLATTSDKVGGSSYGADPYRTCGGCTWSATHGYGRINFERALTAIDAGADFAVSASPAVQGVAAGGSASYSVSVTASGSFEGNVALSATGLPAGATATFTPSSVSTSGTSELRVTTSTATPPGRYALTIAATHAAGTRTAEVTLVVGADLPTVPVVVVVPPPPVPPPPVELPDFSLKVVPGNTSTVRGLTGTFAIAITGKLPAGTVSLSVSGTPAGATATFAPSEATAPGASTLTIATSLATPPGTYVLVITGTSGGVTKSVVAVLGVL